MFHGSLNHNDGPLDSCHDRRVQPHSSEDRMDADSIERYLSVEIARVLEGILNTFLDFDADRCCGAHRYEHSARRAAKRAGTYSRRFRTKLGRLTLDIPKLRNMFFRTAILVRYRRREVRVLSLLRELVLEGPSDARIAGLRKTFWGARMSRNIASQLDRRISMQLNVTSTKFGKVTYDEILIHEAWLQDRWTEDRLESEILVAVRVNQDRVREILAVAGGREDSVPGKAWLSLQLARLGCGYNFSPISSSDSDG